MHVLTVDVGIIQKAIRGNILQEMYIFMNEYGKIFLLRLYNIVEES